MKLFAMLAVLLALQACATAPSDTFPISAGDGRFVLVSVPADQIPGEMKEEMAKAEAYCAKEGKTARIGSIATNVPRNGERRNEVYFSCLAPSEADK